MTAYELAVLAIAAALALAAVRRILAWLAETASPDHLEPVEHVDPEFEVPRRLIREAGRDVPLGLLMVAAFAIAWAGGVQIVGGLL